MTIAIHCHKQTAHPSTITFDRYTAIGHVDPVEWDALTAPHHTFLGRGYLAAIEASGTPSCHVVFRQAGRAVGVASFHVASFNGAPPRSFLSFECPILSFVTRPIRLMAHPIDSKVVVCGSPFASGEHGFAFSPKISRALAGEALVAASKKAKAVLDRQMTTSGVLFKEFYPKNRSLSHSLGRHHFVAFDTEPSMVLPVDNRWRRFDDYLATLSSKYRVKAKRTYTKSAGLVARHLTAEEVWQHRERLQSLYDAVVERAQFKLGGLDIHTLFELRRGMDDRFILRGYFLHQTLVGFSMGFVNGNTLEAGLVGIDYTRNRDHAIYPRMLYDYLRDAIERSLVKVNYGRTAKEIKSTLGALPVEMTCCLRLKKSALNAMLPMLKGAMRPEPFALRKPFKKAWYAQNRERGQALPIALSSPKKKEPPIPVKGNRQCLTPSAFGP